MNKEKYLNRINYTGSLEPTLDLLKKLQKNHLFTVPFENLDIHNKVTIKLDIDRIYEKIVKNNRGGFCYELNGLFYELLISLDFKARRISARVYNEDNKYSPEFDHFTIIVNIDNVDYLCDVGFGEFIYEALKLDLGKIQIDPGGSYLLDSYKDGYLRISKVENGDPKPEFIFKDIERELDEFKAMCEYHQTNPDSHFMKKRLISRPTENGRITLSGNELKIREGNNVIVKGLNSESEFENELWENFKIKM